MEELEMETRGTDKSRAQEEIAQFVALFPQVKPEEVGDEVWRQVREGRSLALAYAVERLRQLERENALLKSRQKGAQLATGSVSSAGSSLGGTVASYWDAYEV